MNAWRLAQHGRAPRVGCMAAVRRLVRAQAPALSGAALVLWARVEGLRPADV